MSDDLITIDLSNIDLGQYPMSTMQDTIDLSSSGYSLTGASTITLTAPLN